MMKPQTTILATLVAAFIVSGLLMLAGCGDESVEIAEGGEGEACFADETCDPGLLCNDAGLCEKETEPDPCEDVDCGEHGLCEVQNDQASCTCEDGFHPDGLSCVQDIDPNTIGPLPVEATPLAEGTLFAAPDGSGETCSEALPCDLWTATDKSLAGDVVFLRGGIYDFNASLNIRHSGTAENPILFESYPQEEAILDGSQNELGSSVYLRLYGDYLIFRLMEIRNMPRQGLYIQGRHNEIDGIVAHHNGLTGIQVVSPYEAYPYGEYGSWNTIRNCITHHNFDEGLEISGFANGGNADGFSISSGEGNIVTHCLAYTNSDDGFDCWRSTNTSFLYSLSFTNGVADGNGSGFKAGGLEPSMGAVVEHCIAHGNTKRAFTYNSGENVRFSYNTSYNNVAGFMSGDTTTVDHNIAAGETNVHSSAGIFDDNSWEREGEIAFISTDPSSPDFLRPTPGGGFADIGAYASAED